MSEIEYFYSAHSAYAYLDSTQLMAIAAAAKQKIIHKPVEQPHSGGRNFIKSGN